MAKRITVDTPDGDGWIELSREVKAEIERLVFEEDMTADDALLEVIESDYDEADDSDDDEADDSDDDESDE